MSGKTVLITGVTHGIGRAMATEFAKLGHIVLGCGRSGDEINLLRVRYGGRHDFYVVNVASDEEVKSWASLLLISHGAPDLLINNAGVINKNARLWEIADDEFSHVIDVNLKGSANIIRHFLPGMLRRRTGIIVNVTSNWGRSAEAEVAPYCASKWGVEGMTMSLAQELPSGMAAVTFDPGMINTSMLQSCFGFSATSRVTPEEWAKHAVPFLLEIGPDQNGKQLHLP